MSAFSVQWMSDEWPHFVVHYIKAFIVLVMPIAFFFFNIQGLSKLRSKIRVGTLVYLRVNQEVNVQLSSGRLVHKILTLNLWFSDFFFFLTKNFCQLES